jgi:hypothetical protein
MYFGILSLILCVLLGTGRCGTTFTMNPWILIFEPDKKIITQVVSFQYHNDASGQDSRAEGPTPNDGKATPKPIEITISSRELTLEGTIIYPSSEGADDFVVYPSQFILYPGDNKKVQVQWVGSKLPSREISLGFIATQLPLTLPEPQEKAKKAVANVEMLTRYEGIIVVRPDKIRPAVVVDTAYSRNDSLGTHLVLILNNKGTGMQVLKGMEVSVTPTDKDGKLKFNERAQIRDIPSNAATNQSLLAGFRRKVELAWPAGFPVVPIKATVSFTENPR